MADEVKVPKETTIGRGCYIITAGSEIYPERSEIRALRKSVETGGTMAFVPWGCSLSESAAAKAVNEAKTTTESHEPVEDF